MGDKPKEPFRLECSHCGRVNQFEQPYAYHAGFSDLCFFYNETGDRTLVWSTFDPMFAELVGEQSTWQLTPELAARLESLLPPSPTGSRWGAGYPGRCLDCGSRLTPPMGESVYFVIYPGSVVLMDPQRGLRSICGAPV
jgi:hypothetical protein